MLKFSVGALVIIFSLAACVSEPLDDSFKGSGNFDTDDAAKTRLSLGLTYLKNGNFTQAKYNLDKALEFAPRSANTHYGMAYYYQQVGEVSRASDAYEQALKIDDRNPDIINSYGAFLCKQGQYDRAKTYFLRAVNSKNYVSTAETFENLAICAQTQGFNNEAIEYFNSALNHQPTRSKSLFMLATLQANEGLWDDAKKSLWKYERSSPVTPESIQLAYKIAKGMGDTKTALGYGELMQQMFPEHPLTASTQQDVELPQVKVINKVANVTMQRVVDDVDNNLNNKSLKNSANMVKSKVGVSNSKPDSNINLSIASEDAEKDGTASDNIHIVKAGENLYRISLQYNVKIQKLLDWNNLDKSSPIGIGMRLWVKDPNKNDK